MCLVDVEYRKCIIEKGIPVIEAKSLDYKKYGAH